MATRGSGRSEGLDGSYDPRYDPAFQRGFDDADREAGGIPARLPARPVLGGSGRARPSEPGPSGPGPGPGSGSGSAEPLQAARSRGPAGPVSDPDPDPLGESSWFAGTGSASARVEPSASTAGSPATEASGLPAAVAADPASDERAAVARARGHRIWMAYTVGLSALAAACMAFGVVLVTRAYGVFNSTTVDSRDDIYWAQLGGQFGPWVFVVGLATGIGVIFLHAARWRPPPE
jgi:hypothetical protein